MSFDEFVSCMAVFILGNREHQAHVMFRMIDDGVGGESRCLH